MSRYRADDVWSEGTSRRQVPALLKEIHEEYGWKRGMVNADIGGGPWPDATNWLKRKGVTNLVYDPGHFDDAATADVLEQILDGQCDTATVANVLNVIPKRADRDEVIELAANCIHGEGAAFFSVHEGDGSGRGRETRDGWQAHRLLDAYLKEVDRFFKDVSITGKRIEGRAPKRCTARVARVYL